MIFRPKEVFGRTRTSRYVQTPVHASKMQEINTMVGLDAHTYCQCGIQDFLPMEFCNKVAANPEKNEKVCALQTSLSSIFSVATLYNPIHSPLRFSLVIFECHNQRTIFVFQTRISHAARRTAKLAIQSGRCMSMSWLVSMMP